MPTNLKLDGNIQAPYITTNGTNLITVPATTGTMALSSSVPTITDWVAYTPTFTGFGTVSNVQIWSRRVGDTLYIRGRVASGTPTAVEAQMTLGYAGTNANVTSSSTKITDIQFAGGLVFNSSVPTMFNTLIEANKGYITFGYQNNSNAGLTKLNANLITVNGSIISFMAEIPVDTWP